MAYTDTAKAIKDLEEALSRTRTLHIRSPPPYGFRPKKGRSKVTELHGDKPQSDVIVHDMHHLGKLHIQSWRSTKDKTNLLLSLDSLSIIEVISTLSPFCKEVQHLVIDVYRFDVSMHTILTSAPSGMKSVQTVSLNCTAGSLILEDALAFSEGCFPYASILKLSGRINLKSSSVSKLTLDLEELVLTLAKSLILPLDSLLDTVSASCRNLKRFQIDSGTYKFPFNTLSKMISQLTCPKLELLKFSPAKISLGKLLTLEGVSWQKSSESCELKLDRASAELPLIDVMHVVSKELKGVTILSLNECDVKLPPKMNVPKQILRKETSIRYIKLSNMKDPVPESGREALCDIFPGVNVTVTLKSPSPHDGADMVHKYRSADEKSRDVPPTPKRRAPSSPAPLKLKRLKRLQLDNEGELEREQASTLTPAHIDMTKIQRSSQLGKQEQHRIPASFIQGKGDEYMKPLVKECHKQIGAEGGKLRLDSFGIELQIPHGAIDTEIPVDISLRVLTDSPTNLGNNKEEVLTCFGVQCLAPDDLVLKKPVTFIIPHCAELHRLTNHSIQAVMYTGEGEYTAGADAKERILLSDKGMPRCVIKRKKLKVQVDHFSWKFFKYIWRNAFFKGKKLYCHPFVPQNIPGEGTPTILHIYLRNGISGNTEFVAKELQLGYVQAHVDMPVLIQWAEEDLNLECRVNELVKKSLSYKRISELHHNCVPFKFNNISKDDTVELRVGQRDKLETELFFYINVSKDHQNASNASLTDQGQGTSKASSSSTGDKVHDDPVPDGKLEVLSQHVPHGKYTRLCEELGIEFNEATTIADSKNDHCKAIRQCLADWKNKNSGSLTRLKEILHNAELGDLVKYLK